MTRLVGLATISVGLAVAAYYILPSLSRYLVWVFSTRSERTSGKGQDHTSHSERTTNGIIPHMHKVRSESHVRNGLTQNSQRAKLGGNGLVPDAFERFVAHDMIMKFQGQRQVKFQFFVVVLASEDDLRDLQSMSFHPHDHSSPRQPLIDNHELTMPSASDYGNYIVARFESCEYHSEEVVFGAKYDVPFSQLWSAYIKRNSGTRPKAIILYSWNFPCGRCTDLIVSVLSKPQYHGVHVMVAYSRIWDSEEGYPYVAKKHMETMRNRVGAYIQYVEPPVPLQEAGVLTSAHTSSF